jgi:hypothetical protein
MVPLWNSKFPALHGGAHMKDDLDALHGAIHHRGIPKVAIHQLQIAGRRGRRRPAHQQTQRLAHFRAKPPDQRLAEKSVGAGYQDARPRCWFGSAR